MNETKLNKGNMLVEILEIVELFIETEEQRLLRIQEEEIDALKEAKRLQKELEEVERLQKEEDERNRIENEIKIVESKEWEKKAAQIIIEHLTESNYNKKTGKEFYDYVMNYISNN